MARKRKLTPEEIEQEHKQKQLKAKLMKIKFAAIGPATPEARRGHIQDTKNPSATIYGSNTQTQNRLRAEKQFINKKKKIRPKGPDAKVNPGFKKRLAKIKAVKTAHEHGHSIIFKKFTKGQYRAASLEGQQGKFAKYWLLNAKQTNGNGWGIAAHTAKQNMSKFIGRPLVVTSAKWHGASVYGDEFDHPYIPTNDLNQIFAHQEQFRVGNIVDIGEKNGDFYATIEMLPKFANMTLPPFCSPAIYQLDAKEAEGNISKWEALHLAALDQNPAYGARIALLKGTCVGTANSCAVQFKSAKQRTAVVRGNMSERQRNVLFNRVSKPQGTATSMQNLIDSEKPKKPIIKGKDNPARKFYDDDGNEISREDYNKQASIVCPKKLKSRLSSLKKKQKIAIQDVREPFKFAPPTELPKLHPQSSKIQSHAVKQLGTSPSFTGSHFLTSDGQLLGDGKREHRDMSHQILKTFKDKSFNEMAATADGKRMSRWGTDGRNMNSLLKQTGMSRVSADDTGINIDAKHPLTSAQRKTILQHITDKNIGSDNVFVDDYTPTQRVFKQLRLGKLKAKLASLGEQNMTYQKSKKIKIHKKKHPEVRKAKGSVEDILRKAGRSVDGSHHQSTFLSKSGEFIGGGDIHAQQIEDILGKKVNMTPDVDIQTADFIKKHGLGRVQTFPINRAGEKKTSVHFNSKATKDQIKAIQDLERGGRSIGFLVGDKTGEGSRDFIKAVGEHKP